VDITVSGSTVTITGNIKTINDYELFKQKLDGMVSNEKKIIIDIIDSISITSSIIGYLTKLVQKDGVDIHIRVRDENLYELLDEINLIELFHVKKVY
jgi:anti-anti-sigma regulatory factor